MAQGHIERLTKSIIERDIKALYLWKIKSLVPCTLFLYLGAIVFWFSCGLGDKSNRDAIILSLLAVYFIITLCVTVCLLYAIAQYFKKNIKYSVVCDTFTEIGTKHELVYGIFGINCLCFSEYGKYVLELYRSYYPWSQFYRMDNDGIMHSSLSGDKFYLVVKNKKILNVYNQKMFTLDGE